VRNAKRQSCVKEKRLQGNKSDCQTKGEENTPIFGKQKRKHNPFTVVFGKSSAVAVV